MLFKLLFLFVAIPLVELALLLKLGSVTEWWIPVLIVVATGAIGATLARMQGFHTFRRIQAEMGQGKIPTDALLDTVMIFFAGALLLTPGLLTDALGLSLLIPFFRNLIRPRIVAWFKSRFQVSSFTSFVTHDPTPDRDDVIDSYVVDPADRD